MEELSAEKFRKFTDVLFDVLGKSDVDVNRLIEAKEAVLRNSEEYKGRSEKELRAIAYSEAVAEMMEPVLTDTDAISRISQKIKQQDRSLWEKIKDFIKGIVEKLKAAYRDMEPDSAIARMTRETVTNSEAVLDAFSEAAADAVLNYNLQEVQKNSAREGVQFMSRNSNDSEIVSIKQQIAEAKDELTQMQSVANVAVQDLSKMTQKQRYDWAVNELKRTGYKVDRPNFGVIEFTPKQINTGMNYLRSAEDVAAFAVLPKVLKQGNIIFENKNHKGRQFATFTISAPVTINGTTGYMAVVVQETSSRHYHTHRIVLPDGSAFKFEMQHSDPSGGFAQNSTHLATNTNAASTDSVAQPNADVKGNVRYSARQATKNLVALHNLTEEKLLKSLELGGFPMPSIAITKADIPHTNFGNITVVFGKETIDPKARRENTVYSADAWTPVVPRVEYEADSKVTDRVYNRLGALKNQVAEYFQHDLDTLRYSLEDRLNRDGGEAGILENLRNNYALKAAFLEEQGTHIEQQTKQVETAVNSISSEMEDKLLNVWEALGKPTPDEIGSTSMKEIRDTYGSELEKAYPGMTKSAFRMSTVLGKLRAYLSGEANATKTSVVADGEAMKKAVDAAVDQGAFERWARELFSGIEKSKGVYNGKERFTPSGNLRSFKATHIPATLEGIVQAMRSENGGNTKNVSGFSGVKTLRAATAEEFGSIADMHRAEGRLQNLTEEQVSQIQDKLGDRLYKLMNDIDAANTKSRWSDNSFIRMDSIGENLTEIGESGRYTPENVKRVFAKYGMEVSDHTAQEVVQLLFDISQMPVNIFEAKPKRAVRFEEIRNVLVPDTASQKLLRELDNRGIPYQVYEAGNEAQRQQMVSQMDDVRFSSRAQQDSEYMELAKDPEYNELELLDMVDAAAAEAGFEYRRNAKRKHKPSNDVEWQMFVRGIDHDQSNYGDYTFLATDKGAIQTEDIMPKLRQLAEEFYGEQISDEEINPPDIVDSAGIWDDMEFVQYMWDNYFEDIFYSTGEMPAIVTEDGMIVYGDDFKRVKSGDAVEYDDNGNVIPLSRRFDTGKEDIRYSARNPQAQVEAENERLKSDVKRQIAEAVREYRRQQDVQSKAYRQMYERQLEEVKKSYQKQISTMESEYSSDLAQIQDAFFQTVEAYEKGQFRNEHLEKVLKQAAETQRAQAKASEADNATWEKEFKRLLKAYETSGRNVERLKQTVENQRARAKAKVEAARVTEERGKLYRAVNEINRRLLNPTKTLYVPDSLAPAVTKFMQGLTEAMESPKNSWNVQGALETLQGQYQKLTQMNEDVFTQEYNQGILDLLDNAVNAVGGTDFNKLSASQIEDVYSAVRSVLTAIRNENKMFAANLNKTYAEAAEAVRREESALPNRKPTTGAVQDKAEKFGWNQLKPVYAMMRLGSDTLLKQYENLRAGEDKWQRVIAAARAYGLGIMAKYHYDQWNDSLMKLDTETGTVELSLEERMSLYAYARREQAFEHLTKGGFVLSDKNTRTVKNRFGIETEQT